MIGFFSVGMEKTNVARTTSCNQNDGRHKSVQLPSLEKPLIEHEQHSCFVSFVTNSCCVSHYLKPDENNTEEVSPILIAVMSNSMA